MEKGTVRFSVWVYRHLLWVYPKEFRARFGDELVDCFEECCEEQAVAGGPIGVARFWSGNLTDLVVTAGRLHLECLAEKLQARPGQRAILVVTLAAVTAVGAQWVFWAVVGVALPRAFRWGATLSPADLYWLIVLPALGAPAAALLFALFNLHSLRGRQSGRPGSSARA